MKPPCRLIIDNNYEGFPERQGIWLLRFLSDQGKVARLIANLDKLFQPTPEQMHEFDTKVNDFQKEAQSRYRELRKVEDIDSDNEELIETGDQINSPTSYLYPSLSRDTGADILDIIANSSDPIPTDNRLDFVFDSMFCEWVYVIDFDLGALEVYAGGFTTSIETRFDNFEVMNQNHDPANFPTDPKARLLLLASFDLNDLPDEQRFLEETALHTEDDTEDDTEDNTEDDTEGNTEDDPNDCEAKTTDSDRESL